MHADDWKGRLHKALLDRLGHGRRQLIAAGEPQQAHIALDRLQVLVVLGAAVLALVLVHELAQDGAVVPQPRRDQGLLSLRAREHPS